MALNTSSNPVENQVKISDAQRYGAAKLDTLFNRSLSRASKNKGLLATVSVLPLAACGGGGGHDLHGFRS